jgi:hypothetical protein
VQASAFHQRQAAAEGHITTAAGSAASGAHHAASFSTELLHLEACLLTALMDVQLRAQDGASPGAAAMALSAASSPRCWRELDSPPQPPPPASSRCHHLRGTSPTTRLAPRTHFEVHSLGVESVNTVGFDSQLLLYAGCVRSAAACLPTTAVVSADARAVVKVAVAAASKGKAAGRAKRSKAMGPYGAIMQAQSGGSGALGTKAQRRRRLRDLATPSYLKPVVTKPN